MTTVIACARDGHVWMAADTRTSVFDRPVLDAANKVRLFSVNYREPVLLGCAGAGGLLDLLEAEENLVLEEPLPDELDAWAADVARLITKLALEAGFRNDDGELDATLVLGYRGRVWTVTHNWAVPHRDGIAAVGSGEGVAIGALDALLGEGAGPGVATRIAARIACARDRHSDEPVRCYHIPYTEPTS